MPKFGTEVSHQLGKTEAQERLQSFSDEIREKLAGQLSEMEENWSEEGNLHFVFKVLGLRIDGVMIVEEQRVTVDGNLPFAAVAFKGKIEMDMKIQLEQVLT